MNTENQKPTTETPSSQGGVRISTKIKFEDLKIGQHAWAMTTYGLVVVAKFENDRLEVCGPWERGINPDKCEILELIDVPNGYESIKLYYGEQY